MKKILVVSDSHGNNANLKKVIPLFGKRGEELAMLIHLGDMGGQYQEIKKMVDCPFEAVRGNGDYGTDLPYTKMIQIGGEKVMLTHGHRYNCKMGVELMRQMAAASGASIIFFGHTHEPLEDTRSDIKIFNPGSISLPRQPGRHPTYMVVTLEDDGRKNFVIVKM